DLLQKDSALTYSTLLMIFNVFSGNYAEGKKHLDKGFALNTGRNQSLTSTLMLRSYEAFFSAMLSDPFEAANLADRNLRYVIHYGHNRGKGRVFLILKAIRDLMNCVGYDPEKAERIRAEYINSKGAE